MIKDQSHSAHSQILVLHSTIPPQRWHYRFDREDESQVSCCQCASFPDIPRSGGLHQCSHSCRKNRTHYIYMQELSQIHVAVVSVS